MNLFQGERNLLEWQSITAEQAVQAIDNFTINTPGKPGWDKILGG